MVLFVERGNSFTVDLGDIDEGFYNALLGMYERATGKVLSLPESQREVFRERLEHIMTSSSGIGWGYHDGLCDMYDEVFPEE